MKKYDFVVIPFLSLASISFILITLKLKGIINLEWWETLTPFLISFCFIGFIFITVLIMLITIKLIMFVLRYNEDD